MKRVAFLLVGLVATIGMSACSDDDNGQCPSVYCDDSGCHACDPDSCYCWDIVNSPCDQGCTQDEYCTSDGICAQRCEFDGNCDEGERCMPEGYCSPAENPKQDCTSDDDCGAGKICQTDNQGGMQCQPAECQSDDDCQAGYVCAECGRCEPKDNPVCGDTKRYCNTNDECGSGRTCNEAGKCVFTCTTNDMCPYGQICSADSICVDDPNPSHTDACVTSSDCSSQIQCKDMGCMCVNTYCHPLCNNNTDCAAQELCDMGICRPNYRPAN
ncbi:MAG: hypothetical protein J7M25_00240 [Deltaproteobacteria bacterium]|nr:hypothetical protein [Deltaproteobacteria bacterium]